MSNEDVIKNQNRNKIRPEKEEYVPNYIRLAKEPVVKELSQKDKYLFEKNTLENFKVPKQAKVYSGNNENWSDSLSEKEEVKLENKSTKKIDKEISTIPPGDYALFVKNELITSSSDLNELESLMEEMLFGGSFKDLSIEDIVLMKRVKIKIGVVSVGEK
jgi:hypothetical protein